MTVTCSSSVTFKDCNNATKRFKERRYLSNVWGDRFLTSTSKRKCFITPLSPVNFIGTPPFPLIASKNEYSMVLYYLRILLSVVNGIYTLLHRSIRGCPTWRAAAYATFSIPTCSIAHTTAA